MTAPRINRIGLVADFSKQGDWAFDLAFSITQRCDATLNVFHFAHSPYEAPLDRAPIQMPAPPLDSKHLVGLDRQLRERYEDKLGEFVDIGFRVCEEGRHNLELRRCLRRREFQLLVIPYLRKAVPFGNMPLEEFAFRFNAAVILVGPDRPQQHRLNPPASSLVRMHGLVDIWCCLTPPKTLQKLPVI